MNCLKSTLFSYREGNADVWDTISNALALSIATASCASSREAMRVPAIRAETAARAERALTASASSASVERATEEITVRQSPIPADRILACTVAYAWERNLGSLILKYDFKRLGHVVHVRHLIIERLVRK